MIRIEILDKNLKNTFHHKNIVIIHILVQRKLRQQNLNHI